jgi:hypothetical protein
MSRSMLWTISKPAPTLFSQPRSFSKIRYLEQKFLGALARRGEIDPRGPKEFLEATEENLLRAIIQVRRDRAEIPSSRIHQAGFDLLSRYEGQVRQYAQRGPWRAHRAPSVVDFIRELQAKLGPRR